MTTAKRVVRLPVRRAAFIGAAMLMLAGCATGPQPLRSATAQPSASAQSDDQHNSVLIVENRPVTPQERIVAQTGRYDYVAAKPLAQQINPLLVVVDVHFPADVSNVGQAANYLLRRSGYRLAAAAGPAAAKTRLLMQQPIPDVQRHIGPATLQDALAALGGPPFRLLVDPLTRVVGYDLKPAYRETAEDQNS